MGNTPCKECGMEKGADIEDPEKCCGKKPQNRKLKLCCACTKKVTPNWGGKPCDFCAERMGKNDPASIQINNTNTNTVSPTISVGAAAAASQGPEVNPMVQKLKQLKELLDCGVLSQQEFETQKAAALAIAA
jgi:hypothetical protein